MKKIVMRHNKSFCELKNTKRDFYFEKSLFFCVSKTHQLLYNKVLHQRKGVLHLLFFLHANKIDMNRRLFLV